MRGFLLALALNSVAFGGSVTYSYTGTPFTACSFGPCPGNYTSDYLTASATFASPLAANLALTNLTSSLTGWTIGDALGNFSYSSSGPSSTYLTGFPSMSIPPLAFSTNSSGGIVNYDVFAFPAEVLGLTGTSEGGTVNPPVNTTCQFGPCTFTDFVEIQWGLPSEWDAISSARGHWTETFNGLQGGTTFSPVFLIGGNPVAGLSGTISGQGSEDFYVFYWSGGTFSATASITGAADTASYLFSEGTVGNCTDGSSQTLNSGDSFGGTISANLVPGQYCIGLDANNAADPNFALTFNTPVNNVPEPSGLLLISAGLGMIGVDRRVRRSRTAARTRV